jgi:multidrug efflux pump subunit AcrA (membrane-fusion protein)
MKGRLRILRLGAPVLLVLLALGCRSSTAPTPISTGSVSEAALSGAAQTENIKALGILQPAQTLQLGFTTGGIVRLVTVEVGTDVKAGDVLAQQDTTALEFGLKQARETVTLRQAALDALLNGPNAALAERAEAEHAQQVAQAEITLQVAQWQLEEARLQEEAEQGAHMLAVALAQSKAEQLDLQLAQAQAQSSAPELTTARVSLTRAQDALETARVEYQKALDRHWEPQEVRDAYAKAVWLAEQDLELAQAQLEGVLDAQRAHALGLDVLASQRAAAGIQLTQTLQAEPTYTFTLALLEAEVDLAQLALDGLRAWQNPYLDPPPPDEIEQVRALLRQAELAVEELEWQLACAQLRAPFDGVISAVHRSLGEWAAPGAPVVELLDTTGWRVETRNVGELNIGRVKVGQEVIVRVNAFAGETLHGYVDTISPVAVVQQGDTTYTLTIKLEPTELNLRPGMTVQVEILTE